VIFCVSRSEFFEVGTYDLANYLSELVPFRADLGATGIRPWGEHREAEAALGRSVTMAFPTSIELLEGDQLYRGDYFVEQVGSLALNTLCPPLPIFPDRLCLQLLIFPVHAAACTGAIFVLTRIGVPRSHLDRSSMRSVFRRVMWSSAWLLLIWIPLAFFSGDLWYFLSKIVWQKSLSSRPFLPRFARIDDSTFALTMPVLGAMIGYAAMLVSVVRRTLHHAESVRMPERWIDRCGTCGYSITSDKTCPECGDAHPKSPKSVYLGVWHARFALRWRCDPFTPVVAASVVVLLCWPLVSGILRTM